MSHCGRLDRIDYFLKSLFFDAMCSFFKFKMSHMLYCISKVNYPSGAGAGAVAPIPSAVFHILVKALVVETLTAITSRLTSSYFYIC